MTELSWLLLLHSVPAKSGALRLSVWRQLKRLGAVSLKTSASVLPDRADLLESFQWLAQRIREQGGEATLVRADDIDGVTWVATDAAPGSFVEVVVDEVVDDYDFHATAQRVLAEVPKPAAEPKRSRSLPVTSTTIGSFGR